MDVRDYSDPTLCSNYELLPLQLILASVTPSVANNSLPPPPRADRRTNNFPKGSSAVNSEGQQSSAHRNLTLSLGARLPDLSDSSRRPSAPARHHNGPFSTGSSREDGTLGGGLQLKEASPMHCARMGPTQPTPSGDYSGKLYPSSTKPTNSNVPLSSSRSSLERFNEWDPKPFYAPPTFLDRKRNNSSTSPFSAGKDSPDPKGPPTPAPQSLIPAPAPPGHPTKASKILGVGVSNVVPAHSRYMVHQPARRSYDEDEQGVQLSRRSKANKVLGLPPDEGKVFVPPPRSHSFGRPATSPQHGAPNLKVVPSNSGSRTRVDSDSNVQEIGDAGRWRRESFMDFSPTVASHQKSKSQPETLSRSSSFQTTFSVMSTDSGIPAFSKPGKSQPNTTLKTFKELMKQVDGNVKEGQAAEEWEKVDDKEVDFGSWGWGSSARARERRPSDWAEARTLPDEDREEQTTPKQTALDLSLAQSAPVNVLDQQERLAVIRKKRKITQLLGTGIPPYTLGPPVPDVSPLERRESWEPLNNQETTYIDAQGNVQKISGFSGSSDSFAPQDTEQSSLIGTRKEKDMKRPDSPLSFMELSDEDSDSLRGKTQGPEHSSLSQQFSEVNLVEPLTPTKASIESSSPIVCRTFTGDLSLSPPGNKTLKHKPSFITEILEDSDWEAKERKKQRDKLAKMHRFLGSRVPAELVLGYSSGTIPPGAPLFEEDEEDTGKGKGRPTSSAGRKNEREMRNLGTMGSSEKMVQIKRAQKIEKVCSCIYSSQGLPNGRNL
jgi:hypothetical protein